MGSLLTALALAWSTWKACHSSVPPTRLCALATFYLSKSNESQNDARGQRDERACGTINIFTMRFASEV